MEKKLALCLAPLAALAASGCQAESMDTFRSAEQMIQGGPIVAEEDYPWAVKLDISYTDEMGNVTSVGNCTGTLIAPNWVLTAGHCVLDDDGTEQFPSNVVDEAQIQVTLGEHDLNSPGTIPEQQPEVVDIIVHESIERPPDLPGGAVSNPLINDIALLELDHSVVLNANVQPIRLSGDSPAPGDETWVAGWGTDVFPVPPSRPPSQFLRELPATVVDPTFAEPGEYSCNDILMNTPGFTIPTASDRPVGSDEICTEPEMTDEPGPWSGCYGDSGGGVVVEPVDGCFEQVGIHTWGDLDCLTYNVALSVPDFLPWIRSHVAGLEGDVVYEAEDVNHQTGGSHPYAWNIYDNGYISFNHTFTGGPEQMVVRAFGEYGNGWPHMQVRINGSVVYSADVDSDEYEIHSFTVNQPAGTRQVQIWFVNDYYAPPVDRNLYVDKAAFVRQGCPPAPEPGVCDEATAIDLGGPGQTKSVATNACVRVRDGFPSWWNTSKVMKLQAWGPTGFPVNYSWSNGCGAGTGSGTFAASWSEPRISNIDDACAMLIQLEGDGSTNINLTYYGE